MGRFHHVELRPRGIVIFSPVKVRLTSNDKIRILNSDDLFAVMQKILIRQDKIRQRSEYFWLIGLETDQTINFIELVAIGAVNYVNLKPREIYRFAVAKNVPKIILAHNHPSGNLNPSEEDKKLTKELIKGGELLGVEVLDHLIISTEGFTSLADQGLLA